MGGEHALYVRKKGKKRKKGWVRIPVHVFFFCWSLRVNLTEFSGVKGFEKGDIPGRYLEITRDHPRFLSSKDPETVTLLIQFLCTITTMQSEHYQSLVGAQSARSPEITRDFLSSKDPETVTLLIQFLCTITTMQSEHYQSVVGAQSGGI